MDYNSYRKDISMFTLPIFVDSATIRSMKADLRKTLPAIKSSHRIEALARALGFQTNAALRAATNQHSSFETIVSWKDFRNYLNGKDFHPTAKPLYLAASKAAIRRIMDRYPMLTRSESAFIRKTIQKKPCKNTHSVLWESVMTCYWILLLKNFYALAT